MSTQSLYSIASHIQDRDVIINIIDDEAELFCCLCIVIHVLLPCVCVEKVDICLQEREELLHRDERFGICGMCLMMTFIPLNN